MKSKNQFSKEFKSKVAITAIKGNKTVAEISSEYNVHSSQIHKWKQKVLRELPEIFSIKKVSCNAEQEKLIENLYKNIGKLQVENEWYKKKLLD